MEFKQKRIIVTGANGLVGLPAVKKCLDEGAEKVYAVDLKFGDNLKFLQSQYGSDKLVLVKTDLTYLSHCEDLFAAEKIDIVLHIAGVKGSPARSSTQPADYLFPMLMFNTNMIKAAFDAKVDWFVYLSSVGVYKPADVMHEEDTWNQEETWASTPSRLDWHPGWTKRMGELTLDSLRVQYGWTNYTVIRPSNIYGINDNFAQDATVISSNIWKCFNVEGDDMVCWGNGSSKRDFVFGDDVAQAAIDVVKKEVRDIINFGCGEAVTIKETIETINECYTELTGKTKNIVWDETKTNGDPIRCLGAKRQEKYGILPQTTLKEGILKSMKEYKNRISLKNITMENDSFYNKRVFFLKNILLKDEIDYLIESCKSNLIKENFMVRGYHKNGERFDNPIVKNMSDKEKLLYLDKNQKFQEVNYQIFLDKSDILDRIHSKLFSIIKNTLKSQKINNQSNYKPVSNILLYNDGHNMSKHTDNVVNRICTTVIYLNEKPNEDAGGEIIFYNDDSEPIKIYSPIQNELILFNGLTKGIIHSVNKIHNWDRMVFRTYWENKNILI